MCHTQSYLVEATNYRMHKRWTFPSEQQSQRSCCKHALYLMPSRGNSCGGLKKLIYEHFLSAFSTFFMPLVDRFCEEKCRERGGCDMQYMSQIQTQPCCSEDSASDNIPLPKGPATGLFGSQMCIDCCLVYETANHCILFYLAFTQLFWNRGCALHPTTVHHGDLQELEGGWNTDLFIKDHSLFPK